VEEEGTVAPCW